MTCGHRALVRAIHSGVITELGCWLPRWREARLIVVITGRARPGYIVPLKYVKLLAAMEPWFRAFQLTHQEKQQYRFPP